MSIVTLQRSERPTRTGYDVASINEAWRRGLLPTPNLNVVDWAERYRRMSRESSNGGRFMVSRREISRGPLMAATEPGVRTISVMTATQLMKTTILESILGRYIHLDPCPILVVQPDDKAAVTFSTDRLAPMIRDTPVLRELMSSRSRDTANTIDHKQFPGGHVTMVGARSPTNLAMRPVRVVLFDEVDKYLASAGKEGDPIMLAEERQAEFPSNKLSVRVCSPTISGHSNIESAYLESDQRKAFVECPHCGEWQALEWEQVRGPNSGPFEKTPSGRIRHETASLYCLSCEKPWTEAQRLLTLRKIEWRQTKAFDCCGKRQTPERWTDAGRACCSICGALAVTNEHAGFMASKLYAPNQSIAELVRKFQLALTKGPEGLKAFFNTQLARTWKEDGEAPEWHSVFDKRDRYLSRTVPQAALILFAGVDVQKDRIEVGVWAFGRSRQRWYIEHRVIPGSVHRAETWAELAKMFGETWRHDSGHEMSVRDWGIDSGAFTSEVYTFVRSQAGLANVHAVDGVDSYVGAFVGLGTKESTVKGKKIRRGIRLLRIGSSYCKQEMLGAMALDRPSHGMPYPAGFIHLPDDISEDHVKQLTSEELITRSERGRVRREWNLIAGRRNEVLDCFDAETEVLTGDGWQRFAALSGTERLATVNLATGNIEYQVPSGLVAREHDGEMVRLLGKRIDILVTPNHRMVTFKKEFDRTTLKWDFSKPPSITLAKDLTIHHQIMVNAKWEGEDAETVTIPQCISKQGRIIATAQDVDAETWARFLGWYVAEGFHEIVDYEGHTRYRVNLCQNEGTKANKIRAVLSSLPWQFIENRRGNRVEWLATSKQLLEAVASCGRLCGEKRVPEWVREASPRIISNFVDAAIDGDGWSQGGFRTYATISRELADGMQELFLKLGKASNIKQTEAKPWAINGRSGMAKPQFWVSECSAKAASLDTSVGGKRRFLGENVPYKGMVYCATVPNGTLVCRRNGKAFVAGNCANYARGLAAMRGWDRWRDTQWGDLERMIGLEKTQSIVEDDVIRIERRPDEKISEQAIRLRPKRQVIRSKFAR